MCTGREKWTRGQSEFGIGWRRRSGATFVQSERSESSESFTPPALGAAFYMNNDEPYNLELFEHTPHDRWRKLISNVRRERTGWRDQEISARHRLWGATCAATDLDFVLAEIHFGEPVALVEYKDFRAREIDRRTATYRALATMADRAGIPFVVVRYWPREWAFRVHPINDLAQEVFADPEDLCELDYVSRLYALRQAVLSRGLSANLGRELPPK